MKRNWETKPTKGPTGFLNTLTMICSTTQITVRTSSPLSTTTTAANNNKHLGHLDNDADVQLGAHVDGVEQHHDHHDQGAKLVPERVVHDDEDGDGDPGVVPPVVDPKGKIVVADHIPT